MQKNKGFSCYFTSQGPPWDTPKSTPGALDAKKHHFEENKSTKQKNKTNQRKFQEFSPLHGIPPGNPFDLKI